jgi:hypothetical protein
VKAEVHPSRFETSECANPRTPDSVDYTRLMHPALLLHNHEVGVMCNAPQTFQCTRKHLQYIYGGSTSTMRSFDTPQTSSPIQQKADMAPHSNHTDSFTTADSHQKPKLTRAIPPRNVEWIEQVEWDSSLQPKDYDIQGTHPDSKILFLNVNILDSTGREPYLGDVLIQGRYTQLINRWRKINIIDRSNHHRRRHCTQCRRTEQRPQSPSLPWSRTYFDVGLGRRSHTPLLEWRGS